MKTFSDTLETLEKLIHDKYKVSDFSGKTKEELLASGFGNWDNKLILIPYTMHGKFMDGEVLECIDDDHRGGMLAYGFYLDNKKLTVDID